MSERPGMRESRESRETRFETHRESRPNETRPERNEDAAATGDGWSVVCDGMGRPPGGEFASAAAVEAIAEAFAAMPRGIPLAEAEDRVRSAIDAAQVAVIEAEHRSGKEAIGTTVAATYVSEGTDGGRTAIIAWLGDTRVYKVNAADRSVERLTRDHSILTIQSRYLTASAVEQRRMEDAIDAAEVKEDMTDEMLRKVFERRNVVTRHLSAARESVAGDLEVRTVPLAVGDELWTFCDGIPGNLTKEKLAELLAGTDPVADRTTRILDAAQAYSRDFSTARAHPDDMSATVLKILP